MMRERAFSEGTAIKLYGCLVMIGTLFIGPATISLADAQPKVLFAKKFTLPLNAGWYWIREDAKAWKVENGKLLLRSLPGYVYVKYNNAQNVLLRKAPVTSKVLILEVFLENQPRHLYEHAALYWYYDEDNHVGILKEWMGNEVKLRLMREKDSEATFAGEPTYTYEGVWLRLVIKGDEATGYYRQPDKEEWRGLGRVNLPSKGEPKVSLNAGGGPENSERWARFSNFRILEQAEGRQTLQPQTTALNSHGLSVDFHKNSFNLTPR